MLPIISCNSSSILPSFNPSISHVCILQIQIVPVWSNFKHDMEKFYDSSNFYVLYDIVEIILIFDANVIE